jgi:gas vesicle protein
VPKRCFKLTIILKKGGISIMAMKDWVKGMVFGGLMGVVLGILYAPKSGTETREDLRKSAEELYEKARNSCEQTQIKMEDLAARGKDLYAGKMKNLKKAVEAGVEAFKEEKAGTSRT